MGTPYEEASSPAVRAQSPQAAASPGHAARVAVTVVGVLLIAWFFVAWLLLERHIVDAAGESLVTAFLLTLAVAGFNTVNRWGARGRRR